MIFIFFNIPSKISLLIVQFFTLFKRQLLGNKKYCCFKSVFELIFDEPLAFFMAGKFAERSLRKLSVRSNLFSTSKLANFIPKIMLLVVLCLIMHTKNLFTYIINYCQYKLCTKDAACAYPSLKGSRFDRRNEN